MKDEEKTEPALSEEELQERITASRKKLMEEAVKHLKGARPMTAEELADDPYVNYGKDD
jgi:hypothetical protein